MVWNWFEGSCTSSRKTPSRMDISPKNAWPNGHYPECTFSWTYTCQKVHLAEWTFPRKPIFQNRQMPECTFGRMNISPKTYFPEWTLARMCIDVSNYYTRWQNRTLLLKKPGKYTYVIYQSGLVPRPCTVHFCIVLRLPYWKKACQYFWIDPWISVTYY